MGYIFLCITTVVVVWGDGDTSSIKDGVVREFVMVEQPEEMFHLVRDTHALKPTKVLLA